MKDAQTIIAKWARNAGSSAALQNYKEGVASVTEAPTHAAAKKLDKYLSSVQDAVNSGRMRDALMSTTLADYQEMAQQKAGNYTSGVKLGQQKFARFVTQFQPLQAQVTAAVNAMPDLTLEDRIAKSAEQARRTAALKGRWRGRFSG